MASIIKKVKKNKAYYYAVQSGRVNGKPRIIWQKYLGTIDDIINHKDKSSDRLEVAEVDVFEAGAVAAMLGIAKKIGLIEIIDSIVPKRDQGPSIGEYIALATINRITSPCSKLKMPEWYKKTVLYRLWMHSPDSFTSQHFWDHMDRIPLEAINDIQEAIAKNVKKEFKLNPELLLYDTTNFFTFIASRNRRNTIAKLGRSKEKRNDLRQVGLALLVTKDFQIPLFHKTYEGNLSDKTIFPDTIEAMQGSYQRVFNTKLEETTLVFDKGNISQDGMEQLIIPKHHFVGGIPKNTFPDIFNTPIESMNHVQGLSGTKAISFEICKWNKKLKVVLVYTESFFSAQLADLTEKIQKREEELKNLNSCISKWAKKKGHKQCPTLASVKKSVNTILSSEHMNNIFQISVDEVDNLPYVTYSIDRKYLDSLINNGLGRTLLVASRLEWSEKEIISAYRSLNSIESAFKKMKHQDFLHWQPMHHWTDQKIAIHAFYCVLALLLASLAHKTVVEGEVDISLPAMIEDLNEIREVAFIYSGTVSKDQRNGISLSKMSTIQKKMADLLEIGQILKG